MLPMKRCVLSPSLATILNREKGDAIPFMLRKFPEVFIVHDIAKDIKAGLEQFREIAADLGEEVA